MSLTVMVVGKFNIESFSVHISETLEAMGHKVVRFEPGVFIESTASTIAKRWGQVKTNLFELAKHIPSFQRMQTHSLLDTAGQAKIDLTLVCHDFLMPAEVRALKKVTKAPVVLWFPDSINTFNRTFFLNADYDALFFKDPYVVDLFNRNLRKKVYYLPECCNPRYHRPCDASPAEAELYRCDITTAGNIYPYRVEFFSQLKDYEVKMWGNPPPLWMDLHGIRHQLQGKFVAYSEKSKSFRCAKIVLNNLHFAEIWGINARAFEIAGVGAFQLVDHRLGLCDLFDDGSELVSFTDIDDLKRKIDYYLVADEERLEIAHRGMLRAHRDHTYEKRLQCLIDTIFKNAQGYPLPAPAATSLDRRATLSCHSHPSMMRS